MSQNIRFNMPVMAGNEKENILKACHDGRISGNGAFTKRCQAVLQELTGSTKALLTTSCTDALEMSAILANIRPGDEVIIPSFTFVSTANAFILRGAKVVFADSRPDHPGIDETTLESLVTPRTKAIVPVHYAGVACDMDAIVAAARPKGIKVIEDAAQAIDSYYNGSDGVRKALGSIGDMGTFSFHETKNLQCGEGGALLLNDTAYVKRAEIIWEKGTDRAAFWRGEVDKYGWVDIGSSFLPSELTAAFLSAQLDELKNIQQKRMDVWQRYAAGLADVFHNNEVSGPEIPDHATNNAHMYYMVCDSLNERSALIDHLKSNGIGAVFHYQSLHASPYFKKEHDGRDLPWSDVYSERLVRLPLHTSLTHDQQDFVISEIRKFYGC